MKRYSLVGLIAILAAVAVSAAVVEVPEAPARMTAPMAAGGGGGAAEPAYEIGPLTFDSVTASDWSAIVGDTNNLTTDSTGVYIDGYGSCPNAKVLYYDIIELTSSSHTVQADITATSGYDSGGIAFNCTATDCFYVFFDNTNHICIQDNDGNLGPTCAGTAESGAGTYTVKVTLATNTVNVWVGVNQRITNGTITNKTGTYAGIYLDSNGCAKVSVDNLWADVP